MVNERYKPLIDKLYWVILASTVAILLFMTAVASFSQIALFITIFADLTVIYFFVSPLFGYVELRENSVYIKYGLLLSKEIPYEKIRGAVKERKFYSDSMASLKNSFEHVNLKYNTFDVTTVSVVDNDGLIKTLQERCADCK